MKRYLTIPAAIAMACSGSSCTNSSHLLLYQHSNMGLNTAVNPSNQSVHVRVGIRREFGAVVPKYIKPSAPGAKDDYEAASAYFGSRFRVSSIWQVPEAAEILTTGQAAVLSASEGKLKLKENHDQLPPSDTTTNVEEAVNEVVEEVTTETTPISGT